MSKNNYPTAQLEEIDKPAVQQMVTSLKQLYDLGKPKNDEEVAQRIDQYFGFCQNSSIRPGIEALCLSLHISRVTLFNWSNGTGCSPQRQEAVQSAKAFVSAYIEQATLSGRLNPASSIFLLKNWCNYRDAYSFETSSEGNNRLHQEHTPEEIATRLAEDIPIDIDD